MGKQGTRMVPSRGKALLEETLQKTPVLTKQPCWAGPCPVCSLFCATEIDNRAGCRGGWGGREHWGWEGGCHSFLACGDDKVLMQQLTQVLASEIKEALGNALRETGTKVGCKSLC